MLFWLLKLLHGRVPDLVIAPLQPLYQLEFRAGAAAALAFFIVVLCGKRTIAQLVRMKVGDTGMTDADALRSGASSKKNTPTMGGVLIAGAMLLAVVLLADLSVFYVQASILVIVWLAVLGGFDDWLKLTAAQRGAGSRQGLRAWEKLIFQLGLGLLVGLFAYRHGDAGPGMDLAHVINLPGQRTYVPTLDFAVNEALWYASRWVYVTIAVLMIAGMSNAVNITDGMDGLATGASAVVALGLVILTLIAGQQASAQSLLVPYVNEGGELSVLAGAMLGACLGFLWFNAYPAQVFMGDTGALCIGGVIGYIAVITRQEIVVLLMCGVFLLEIGSVVLQVGCFKLTRRFSTTGPKRIFRVAPYHHHLHLGGVAEPKVVIRLWIVAVVLTLLALVSIKIR
jgi:phospho-N-acetylmuramoyl-pentapeptide-transferase